MMFSFEMERSQPYAPKELEGEYKLVVNGRKMRLTKVSDGTKTRATCNKTDNWNMARGISTCLERIKDKKAAAEIKVGDKVEIVDEGLNYPYYASWVVKNIKDPLEIARFVNCGDQKLNGLIGKVLAVAPWDNEGRMLAYVQIDNCHANQNYVIGVNGLRKI